jgi:YVTN family beta-propeller protein
VSGGQFGDGLEITPDGGYLFFSRKGAVSFIDTSNNVVSGSFGSPARPEDIAFSPDGRRAYMADSFESTISVVDLTDGGATLARINVADFHYQKRVAVAPDGLRVYATDSYGDKLSVIDTATNSVVGVVNFAQQAAGAWDVAVTASAGRAFVTRPGVDAVEVIDTSSNSLEKTLSVGSYPRGIVMSPDGHRAYVANFSSGSVSVIDTSSAEVVATIAGVGSSPDMIAVSRDGARVFVVSQELDSDTISVIDTTTNTVEKSLHMGTDLTAIAAHPDGHRVYVIDRGYGTLSIVDTNADG